MVDDFGKVVWIELPVWRALQVNLKLFTPAPGRKRTVLLFVFRDRTRTPLSRLVETWEEDLGRMWAAIPKPPQYDATSVSDFFDVRFTHHQMSVTRKIGRRCVNSKLASSILMVDDSAAHVLLICPHPLRRILTVYCAHSTDNCFHV